MAVLPSLTAMKGMRRRLAVTAAAAIAAGCALLTGVPATGHAAPASLEGVPRVAHVVTLILENEDFSTTWSPTSPAKYLNSLVPDGAFVPQYYATGHVSLDNYIAMTSGVAGAQIAPTYTDCAGLSLWTCAQDVSAATLLSGSIADQIEQAGLTWKEYADGTSAPCVHDAYSPTAGPDSFQGDNPTPESSTAGPNYADRHVPWLYYSNIVGDDARCSAHLRPFTELSTDIADNTLPAYSFITPDTCDDGHDSPCADGRPGGLTTADAFLQANLPSLLTYLDSHDGVLFITTDEGDVFSTDGCCHGGPAGQAGFGGQVGLLALGRMVAAGSTSSAQYDHASLLRTTEDLLGISTHINNAASSTPMTDIWNGAAHAGANVAAHSAASRSRATVAEALTSLPDTASEAGTAGAAGLAVLLGAFTLRRRRSRQIRA
jgi:MYXO-CTERM domain-containing protein